MISLKPYPSLRNLINLLTRTTVPAPREEDRPIDNERGEKLLGTLTAGEAHLYLAMVEAEEEAREATRAVDPENMSPEIVQLLITMDYMVKSFQLIVLERFGNKETEIRYGFQVVQVPYDCGCGQGLQCHAVKGGMINPYTGEETITPETLAKSKASIVDTVVSGTGLSRPLAEMIVGAHFGTAGRSPLGFDGAFGSVPFRLDDIGANLPVDLLLGNVDTLLGKALDDLADDLGLSADDLFGDGLADPEDDLELLLQDLEERERGGGL